jgi:hypothetical protein
METTFSQEEIALYVGAGCHIYPITDLPDIKIFYYLDSQPNSEFGIKKYGMYGKRKVCGKRPEFIKDLDDEMEEFSMRLTEVNKNLRIYTNEKQHIYYYTNIAVPELFPEIKASIENFTTLILSGYSPDSIILEATTKKIHLVAYKWTTYDEDLKKPNSIISRLHRGEINDRFYKYTLINQGDGDYLDVSVGVPISFDSWEGFYEYHQRTFYDAVDEVK